MPEATAATRATPRLSRFRSYCRLGKADFYDFYFAVPLVWAMLAVGDRADPSVLAALLAWLVGMFGVVPAVMAFDDITGYRDGSDAKNYIGRSGQLRKLDRKPLLTGALTEAQAVRFAFGAWAWGAVWWAIAIAIAPSRPTWAIGLAVLTLSLSIQYSHGLRLSYHGLGEALIAYAPTAVVLVPYGLASGPNLPGGVAVTAVLFGLWQVLVSCYSNSNDREGDRAVGRNTIAALASERGNQVFILALSLLDICLVIVTLMVGWLPLPVSFLLLLVVVLRIRQVRGWLMTGRSLLARRRGVIAFRVGVLTLAFVHFWVTWKI